MSWSPCPELDTPVVLSSGEQAIALQSRRRLSRDDSYDETVEPAAAVKFANARRG